MVSLFFAVSTIRKSTLEYFSCKMPFIIQYTLMNKSILPVPLLTSSTPLKDNFFIDNQILIF